MIKKLYQKEINIRFLRKGEKISKLNLVFFRSAYDFDTPIQKFNCSFLPIRSLVGGPEDVLYYDCSSCDLTTLNGAPKKVVEFNCQDNHLVSLKHSPTDVNLLNCGNNNLKSLLSAPISAVSFIADNNQITSLSGIGNKYLRNCVHINIEDNPITSNILGLFQVKGLKSILADDIEPFEILKEYFYKKNKDVLGCQEELMSAGYKEYARL